jgi:Tol biopolymer transport system component/tRNA A-37 threonylcarbamoyl transferase component Bud32
LAAQLPDCFGPYEVIALLGAGGMGEVYRARDPRLNRQVAIKVLARAGADTARQRRLLDEAQAASALNHPNIITVYDVGTHDGTPFIVSELVEGASLREMLGRAPLAVRDVLDLGAQMAEGLAAAHQAGIVHRDFKPENVMVTPEGRVKILDFGLALVGTRDGAPATSVEKTLTVAGMIVGTIPYMSPEQARGAAVDFRTDQFSLGLTMYEMVAGRRAFAGETPAQTLAGILDDEPEPIGKINPRAPAPLRWLIERCLTKDARQRYDSTADLARELRTLPARLAEFSSSAEVPAQTTRRRGRALLTIGALAAVAAIGVLAGVASGGGADVGFDRYRFSPIATDAGYQASPAWSPDGKTLAYVAVVNGVLQVFTKAPESPTRNPVTHQRWDCRDPFWSPDGKRIYFISLLRDRDGLYSISAAGGDPDPVVEDVSRAAISPDGKTLAFFRDSGVGRKQLFLASPIESEPKPYTQLPFARETGFVEASLHFSPDGTKLGVWVERGEGTALRAEFWLLPTAGGAPYRSPVPADDVVGVAPPFAWLPDSRRIVSALPVPAPGTHLWLSDTESGTRRLLTSTGGLENDPAVSPDGGRLALTFQQADYDLYQFSTVHAAPTAVLATSRSEMDPAWSPTGKEMAFTTDRSGRAEIWVRSRDGDERPVVTPSDFAAGSTYLLSSPAFSPDGLRIAYNHAGPEGMQIWISPNTGGRPIQLVQAGITQDWPSWSPDGMTIAYAQAIKGDWSLAKARVGGATSEIVVKEIVAFSPVQWAPGESGWIAFNGTEGLSIVTPDGTKKQVLHEQAWMAFDWSSDGRRLFGIRLSDDYQHLTFTSVDVPSGVERVVSPDFMPLPVAARLVRGMTRTSPTTFRASLVQVRSDVWLLEGFLPAPTLWDRLASVLPFRH